MNILRLCQETLATNSYKRMVAKTLDHVPGSFVPPTFGEASTEDGLPGKYCATDAELWSDTL